MTRDLESERSQAEGTSLLHISFAVKHDLVSGLSVQIVKVITSVCMLCVLCFEIV